VGILQYASQQFELEDRLLAHVQIVISTKLRRYEPFMLSWKQPTEMGSGRQALWIENGVPIHFFFYGTRPVSINRAWIEELLLGASRAMGVLIGDEPTRAEG
jgi:hypothetical protein